LGESDPIGVANAQLEPVAASRSRQCVPGHLLRDDRVIGLQGPNLHVRAGALRK
jgi:hypothetical protein